MQRLRELGNARFLCLKAIPYGFRPFLVDRDRKEFIAVIERIEARIRIARDAIVRRRRSIGRRRFLNLLRLWQFLRERQRFPQQGFNPLTRLRGSSVIPTACRVQEKASVNPDARVPPHARFLRWPTSPDGQLPPLRAGCETVHTLARPWGLRRGLSCWTIT